jgi:alpha-beta hydrolase superfamily lysophospholipase
MTAREGPGDTGTPAGDAGPGPARSPAGVPADATRSPAGVPADPRAIEDWLRARESRFHDLVPGTERRIVWDDADDPAPTDLALVYLHGFSATHRETAPLTELVAAELGANAYLTRLTGHGRPGWALGEARADDWFRDTAEAVAIGRRIGRRVVLLGVSTGGALAVWAATRDASRDAIAALVLLSPNFGLRDRGGRYLAWPGGRLLARLVIGKERVLEAHTEAQARFWTPRYPTSAIVEVARVVRRVRSGPLREIRIPALTIYSPADQVIDPDEVEEAHARLPEPKSIIRIDDPVGPSNHVLAGDILAPDATGPMANRIATFLREVLEG